MAHPHPALRHVREVAYLPVWVRFPSLADRRFELEHISQLHLQREERATRYSVRAPSSVSSAELTYRIALQWLHCNSSVLKNCRCLQEPHGTFEVTPSYGESSLPPPLRCIRNPSNTSICSFRPVLEHGCCPYPHRHSSLALPQHREDCMLRSLRRREHGVQGAQRQPLGPAPTRSA